MQPPPIPKKKAGSNWSLLGIFIFLAVMGVIRGLHKNKHPDAPQTSITTDSPAGSSNSVLTTSAPFNKERALPTSPNTAFNRVVQPAVDQAPGAVLPATLIGKKVSIPSPNGIQNEGEIVGICTDGVILKTAVGPAKILYSNMPQQVALSLGCKPSLLGRFINERPETPPSGNNSAQAEISERPLYRQVINERLARAEELRIKAYNDNLSAVQESERKRWADHKKNLDQERERIAAFETGHRNDSYIYKRSGNSSSSSSSGLLTKSAHSSGSDAFHDGSGAVTVSSSGGWTSITPISGANAGVPHSVYTGAQDGTGLGYKDSCGWVSAPLLMNTPTYDPTH